MSFDVSPLAGIALRGAVRGSHAPRRALAGVVRRRRRRRRRAADPGRGLGSGRRRRASGRQAAAPRAAQVRFDVHKLDGGVVASLVDDDGGMLRPLLLEDVVDVGRLTHELGKEH